MPEQKIDWPIFARALMVAVGGLMEVITTHILHLFIPSPFLVVKGVSFSVEYFLYTFVLIQLANRPKTFNLNSICITG